MYSEVHNSVNCQEIVMYHTVHHLNDNFVQNLPIPTAHFEDLTQEPPFTRVSHKYVSQVTPK
jgi:hypothetical protein